jgi:cytochrome c556
MKGKRTLFALLAGVFLFSFAPQSFAQEEEIEARKKLMKSNRKASKAFKTAVKEMDYAAIQTNAKKISINMDKVAKLFPKGSTAKDSRAQKTIWSDWQGFNENIGWVKNSAKNLATAATAKDADLVKLENQAVSTACSQCHRSYRKGRRGGKKKKKS